MTSNTRKEVMAHLIIVYRQAKEAGRDGWKAVQAAAPGIPIEVVAEVEVEASAEDVEAWWQSVERTIDGELVGRALAAPTAE